MPVESIYRRFGEEVAALRREQGVTQEEAAKRAGMPRPLWSKLERGRFRVQLHSLPKVAEALRVSASSLLLWAMSGRGASTPASNAKLMRKLGGA